MKQYFNETPIGNSGLLLENIVLGSPTSPATVPISVNHSAAWEIVESPNRFMKTFEFENFPVLKAFVDEILDFQEEFGHHGQIMIRDGEVTIEVYTHGVNDITELDQEYVCAIGHIYTDVSNYFLLNVDDVATYDL